MNPTTGCSAMDNAPITSSTNRVDWINGPVPITVVMITLNEAHNLRRSLENLRGWAHSVLVVDSYSQDSTIDLCLEFGVRVIQRKFDGFGSQWDFAVNGAGISTPWTMKLDPDEHITDGLKKSISNAIEDNRFDGFFIDLQLFFMGAPLPVELNMLRIWRTGSCRFTDIPANEHAIVSGRLKSLDGVAEHHDSPNLHHWFHKQNFYTTAEANNQAKAWALAAEPRLFGSRLERVAWVKRHFWRLPFRYHILFLYNYLILGAYRAGRPGYIWARLRSFVYWQWELKYYEIIATGRSQFVPPSGSGRPDIRVQQF